MPAPTTTVHDPAVPASAVRRGSPAAPGRLRRRGTFVLAGILVVGGSLLTGCNGDDDSTAQGSTSTSASGPAVPAGWVRAETPTVTVDFPATWVRINDTNLGDGVAARSPELSDGTRAVVAVRILGVGMGDAQAIGDSPATAAADQTLSQLQEAGVKGAKVTSGSVAGRPGWVIRWEQANTRDPKKRVYQHTWGVADVGTRQFVVVTSQAIPDQWATAKIEDILASIRMPLAVPPTSTPTRTPDGSGDVVLDKPGAAPGDVDPAAPGGSPSPSGSATQPSGSPSK